MTSLTTWLTAVSARLDITCENDKDLLFTHAPTDLKLACKVINLLSQELNWYTSTNANSREVFRKVDALLAASRKGDV